MIPTSYTVFAALNFFASSTALADARTYQCEVSHVYNLTDTESLEHSTELEKIMNHGSFYVDRESGAIIGKLLSLDTTLAKSKRVINKGSEKNSFESVADFGDRFKNGAHPYQLLKIEEFRTGVAKPFVLMGEVGIVTGTCK